MYFSRIYIILLWLTFLFGNAWAEIMIEQINKDVNITYSNDLKYSANMDENNHNFDKFVQLFKIDGTDKLSCNGLAVSFTGSKFNYNISDDCIFSSLESFDYESKQRDYLIVIENTVFIRLTINNIDDETPTISPINCKLNETTIYTVKDSTCKCTVADADGWMDEMTFSIYPGTAIEDTVFTLDYDVVPAAEGVYEAEVILYPKQMLHYEITNTYSFSISATDGAKHTSDKTKAIVNVVDQRNTKPVWTTLVQFLQFNEQDPQDFQVIAIDGDTGINSAIYYYKNSEDLPDDYVSIDKESGKVHINPIDRDKDDLTIYKFELAACVHDLEAWCTNKTIQSYIVDIDNKIPNMTKNVEDSGTITEFGIDEKVMTLSYFENYDKRYNVTTIIVDKDTGENAQFTVKLENVEDSETDYTEPYMIIPESGYKSGTFRISVKDKTYLDFENPIWRYHRYYIVSNGVYNVSKTDRMLVNVTLIDYNDEIPIFNSSSYSVNLNETAKKGDYVITTSATDRDAGDNILTMGIVGDYAAERLSIDFSGKILVSVDNAFDYDIQKTIDFQVSAADKGNHIEFAQVKINILDMNNKAPTIDPVDDVKVEENQKNGEILNITITASDVDTTAKLTSSINWKESYVTKNSVKLIQNETVETAMKFLKVSNTQLNNGRSLSIQLVVENNDDKKPNKPDFELFDVLYLQITVEDLMTDPEFEKNRYTSKTIPITILDINDNPPYFPDTNKDNRTVQEVAVKGTTAGIIKALDVDTVSTNVTFYCNALNESFDWIEVDAFTGVFTVRNDDLVDADKPVTYINYTCEAFDELFYSDPLPVSFYIIDTNNKNPKILIDKTVSVLEKSDKDTLVSNINTSDKDRDIPFHTVTCSFDAGNECAQQFKIVNNDIKVLNGKNDIDRDKGPSIYQCKIVCSDNINEERNQGIRTSTQDLNITLIDINDHTPQLVTTELKCSENLKQNTDIGPILGEDIDAGKNALIDFTLTSVTNDATGIDVTTFYEVNKREDYFVNDTLKKVHLIAVKDLKGNYGTFTVNLHVEDEGDPPNKNDTSFTLTVEKYNYHSPTIEFPEKDAKIFLLSTQTPGKPLISFQSGNKLADFTATDGETTDCSKWNVEFTFSDISDQKDDIFKLVTLENCKAQLQINNNFDSTNVLKKTYKLTLTASITDSNTPQNSEASYSCSENVNIIFLDNKDQPTFADTNPWVVETPEADTSRSFPLTQRASYDVSVPTNLSIFYYLVSDTKKMYELFNIDSNTGSLSVKGIFYYDDDEEFDFQIVASNDTNPDTSTDPDSFLSVKVKVQSTNRRPPHWKNAPFFGALMPDLTTGYPVLTAEAYDEDKIDQGRLKCFITGDVEKKGNGIENFDNPFVVQVENDTAKISSNFPTDSSMSGYFKFKLTVEDNDDPYGHNATRIDTETTVFIITTDNTVDFLFYNTIHDLNEKKKEMLEIVSDILGFDAYCQRTDNSTKSNGETLAMARLYFIDKGEEFTLISSSTISKLVGNVGTFAKLSNKLKDEQGLMLSTFGSLNPNTNNEAVLKAWLMGVSVVLGVLCIILIISFLIKTRQLKKRISNLTTKQFGSQESGLNRLGITAPTTNKHAVEGTNPIYNHEEKKPPKNLTDFDSHSVRSGDSDLIGVEDNPQFDYNFNEPKEDKTTYL